MIQTTNYYPESLKPLHVWCLWKLEPDKKTGKMTKVPKSALYDGNASSTNPDSWTTFDRAEAKLEENPDKYNGIALAVADGVIFIDIDHCVDEAGQLSETASDILSVCDTQFVELSQSGAGIHILARGTIPRNFKNSKNGVEMYSGKRFCSMTGNAICPNEPHENQAVIDAIFERYKTSKPEIKSLKRQISALQKDDRWIIERATRRGRFKELYLGNWSSMYESQSEADLALCSILAFWCDCDHVQMDRIFRASGLYRLKWERAAYRRDTLEKAICHCDETLSEFIERRNKEDERTYLKMW